MIYLIGGAMRIGKTTLSRRILEQNKIPYIPTDLLRNALYNYRNIEVKDWPKWGDRPADFFPYLSDFLRRANNKYPEGCVIEGDIFFPEQIASLKQDWLKCIFLGSSNITLEQIKTNDPDSWVEKMDTASQESLPKGIMDKSRMFKEEANKYGFAYFDISPDRETALKEAYNYLFK